MKNESTYEGIHRANVLRYEKDVINAYNEVIEEAAKLKYQLNTAGYFYFSDNYVINQKIDNYIDTLFSKIEGYTVNGVQSEWSLAVEKNNDVALRVFGKRLEELPDAYKMRYLSTNADSRDAFIQRKVKGLGLSDRIWKQTKPFKNQLEVAIEQVIIDGSTDVKSIKKYLNEPDKLFRRIRNSNNELRLSRAANAYNPGRGYYRSSHKNALRLIRNETNFAYEKSNFEKRKQQDFITGIEIKVSKNHNPADDKGGISCLSLQGKYPKDFDFTYKWHVNCKCQTFNVTKTPKEIDSDVDNILNGREPNPPETSKEYVKEKPDNFRNYVKDNAEKLEKAKPWTFQNNNIDITDF